VHLGTARLTRDGDAVDLDLPAVSSAIGLPWLPYDEAMLERIAATVDALRPR
jgi:hypothetical protein